MLWALMQPADGIVQQVFGRLGIDSQQVVQQLDQALAKLPSDPTFQHSPHMLAISAGVLSVLQKAEELANELPDLQIDASHIFLAICEDADGVSAQILHSFGVTPERLRVVLIDIHATHPATAPQAPTQRSTDWEQRVEQQLTRIETELAAIRSMLARQNGSES